MMEGKTNIANIHKVLENPIGRRQAVSYPHCTVEELNLGWPRMEDLIPGPPDNKSSTLTRMDLETPTYQMTKEIGPPHYWTINSQISLCLLFDNL